jgi:hypothetical protein
MREADFRRHRRTDRRHSAHPRSQIRRNARSPCPKPACRYRGFCSSDPSDGNRASAAVAIFSSSFAVRCRPSQIDGFSAASARFRYHTARLRSSAALFSLVTSGDSNWKYLRPTAHKTEAFDWKWGKRARLQRLFSQNGKSNGIPIVYPGLAPTYLSSGASRRVDHGPRPMAILKRGRLPAGSRRCSRIRGLRAAETIRIFCRGNPLEATLNGGQQ